MKKVLILSPHPEWGGSATANIMIAKMLINEGFDVIYNDEYTELNSYNNVQITHFPFHKEKRHRNSSLINFVYENNINVVFWGLPQLFAFFYPAEKEFKKKGIVQLTIFHSLSLTNGFRGRISELISAVSVGKMNHIVFVSHYTMLSWSKYFLFRKYHKRSHVIYNAVTIPSITHIVKDMKNPTIGYVGRFSDEKNPELFCQLSERYVGKCIAYGDGPLLQECKIKYPKVDFRGQVMSQDAIYDDIDILVMTSKFENCPMVILEAMSRGIPCIAPNVGGIPEIINNKENGILYDSFNENELLSEIDNIKKEYDRYRKNCLFLRSLYSFETISKEWGKIMSD